jgi:hypothetical protein
MLSYYVLRDEMMSYFLSDISERLPAAMSGQGWEVSPRGQRPLNFVLRVLGSRGHHALYLVNTRSYPCGEE